MKTESEKMHISHFNDVYGINEKETEPVEEETRFIATAENYRDINPLILFSGDIISPSKLSKIMKGK